MKATTSESKRYLATSREDILLVIDNDSSLCTKELSLFISKTFASRVQKARISWTSISQEFQDHHQIQHPIFLDVFDCTITIKYDNDPDRHRRISDTLLSISYYPKGHTSVLRVNCLYSLGTRKLVRRLLGFLLVMMVDQLELCSVDDYMTLDASGDVNGYFFGLVSMYLSWGMRIFNCVYKDSRNLPTMDAELMYKDVCKFIKDGDDGESQKYISIEMGARIGTVLPYFREVLNVHHDVVMGDTELSSVLNILKSNVSLIS
jgi:hypothetical protein